jgi:tungstate transport system ATP-binding protein
MSNLLVAARLRKAFGERVLFDIANFTLEESTAYVLTGINGAGKTSLLRILGGLDQAEPTSLLYRDELLGLAPYPARLRREVLYVHQDPVMFSTTVAKNIGYGLQARGEPRERIARVVKAAMAWAGVAHLEGANPASLSAARSSALRWRAPRCSSRACCCSMNRPPISMARLANR